MGCPGCKKAHRSQHHSHTDESKELATYYQRTGNLCCGNVLKFIFGTESFDNWDNYIETLNGMKLDRALEIENAALERYNAR